MNTQKILVSLMIITVFAGQSVYADQDRGGRHPGKEKRKDFLEQKKSDNKAFRKTLKDLTPQEKVKAIAQHRQEQYQENQASRGNFHQEKLKHIQEKLSQNNKLTDEQKTQLTQYLDTQYKENIEFRDKQHAENVAFFEQLAADPNLTDQQLKQAMKDHLKTQKDENKSYWSQQKTERKEFKNSLGFARAVPQAS